MKIEHVALNVPDPVQMSRWYVEHLGMTVKWRMVEAPMAHFLADDGDAVMLELYHKPEAGIPDYNEIHIANLHVAFLTHDLAKDQGRLQAVGAKLASEVETLPTGDSLVFLRDPWGVPVQLIQRAKPLI